MSDGKVRAAIEQMDTWLADPSWEPDPEALAQWNAGFQEAVDQAEKTKGWSDLVARAHRLGQDLEVRIARSAQLRDEARAELDAQERGSRALRGYGASAR